MQRFNIEIAVGVFVVAGLLALGYLSIKLGEVKLIPDDTYTLRAIFPNVAGLKAAAEVEIAGVPVGRVASIRLEDFSAVVILRLDADVRLSDDTIASIRTRGLIGEKYIRILPGGSEQLIQPGGRIREIETPVDFEDLIASFIQGKI